MDFAVLPDACCQGLFHQIYGKSHSTHFLPEQTLDFVLHRLLAGLAEMDMDDVGGLADGSLECRARFSFRCVCGICHRKSSCKKIVVGKEEGKAATLRYL